MTQSSSAAAKPGRTGPAAALPWAIRLGSLALLLGAWEIYGRAQDNPLSFVPLSEVIPALVDLVQRQEFWSAYQETLVPFIYGWLLAISIGLVLGLLTGTYQTISAIFRPYLAFLQALPMSAVIPVVVIALGIGMTSRVAVVFLFAIADMTINTASGVRYVDRQLVEMARSFGARERSLFLRVLLPGSTPGVMAGVRIATGRAVIGMVVVEFLLVSVGLGRLIGRFQGSFQTAELFATVLALSCFGVILLELVRRFERRLLRWRPER
ncbi:MAG: ABC transporter permease subunit [Dehalococcoidia bacterium]|nr:ABC transporter permease subunit [Dehalococcoidia bacterium]